MSLFEILTLYTSDSALSKLFVLGYMGLRKTAVFLQNHSYAKQYYAYTDDYHTYESQLKHQISFSVQIKCKITIFYWIFNPLFY